uniref:Carbohydrate kinase PfkB domain-containing protein n=1 Tax=Ditylenchus dipsaci TaxID=166011 RepID=A0A915EHE9_9BILA
MVEKAVEIALEDAKKANISNKEVGINTFLYSIIKKIALDNPFLLKRVNELTGSASLRINIALLENNARIAAELAHIHYSSSPQMGQPSVVSTSKMNSTPDNQERRRPKVLVVGASICDFETVTEVEHALLDEGAYHPGQIYQRAGGVARNHADALNRLAVRLPLFLSLAGTVSLIFA